MDFVHRLAKEGKITAEAFRETVLAVAERVNRKVQILMLHWRAASVHEQIDAAHASLGQRLCAILTGAHEPEWHRDPVAGPHAEMILLESIGKARLLKQELQSLDMLVRELETDILQEDLITLQHDLSLRAAMIRRVVVEPDAPANGRSVLQLELPSTVRLAAILRGPTLLSSVAHVDLRSGDVLVLVGPRTDLHQSLPFFNQPARI